MAAASFLRLLSVSCAAGHQVTHSRCLVKAHCLLCLPSHSMSFIYQGWLSPALWPSADLQSAQTAGLSPGFLSWPWESSQSHCSRENVTGSPSVRTSGTVVTETVSTHVPTRHHSCSGTWDLVQRTRELVTSAHQSWGDGPSSTSAPPVHQDKGIPHCFVIGHVIVWLLEVQGLRETACKSLPVIDSRPFSKISFEPAKLTTEDMGSCFTLLKLELACQEL